MNQELFNIYGNETLFKYSSTFEKKKTTKIRIILQIKMSIKHTITNIYTR